MIAAELAGLAEVAMATANEAQKASGMQMWGAFAFGLVVGWYLYYLNRYRKEVTLADLTTVVGAVGGAAVLALFPAETDLFGAYGLGERASAVCAADATVRRSGGAGPDPHLPARRASPVDFLRPG